jgi:hypothetical protein
MRGTTARETFELQLLDTIDISGALMRDSTYKMAF